MLRAAAGFVVFSAIAGVLATVGATPVIALSGVAASNSIGLFQGLPSYLEVGQLMQKTNIYAGDQANPTLLASFYDQNRVEVGFDQIAQSAKDAAVAGEDPRFYEHGGIDLQGTIRAALSTYVLGGDTQGGSSITQQYVKNVLVQKAESIADETERQAAYDEVTATTPERKLREMRLAIGLEKESSKDEILTGYLNIALFGGTVYGIEAAANYYYGISASQLSVAQSASLVAIVNNPERFRLDQPEDPDNGSANGYAANKQRRDYIIDEMLEHGKITQAEHDEAVATVIAPTITQPSTGCATAGNAAFFCDYVTYQLRNDPAFGETDDERYANIRRGGYEIYTTIDLDAQAATQAALDAQIPQTDPRFDVGAAASSVQAGTGRVLAMVQNKKYSQEESVLASDPSYSAINYNVDLDEGGTSGFQVGSTYKVFTLADWLTQGHTLTETFDSRRQNWTGFTDSCLGTQNYGPASGGEYFNPKNDSTSEDSSTRNALTSTTLSVNTGFIGMAHELDLCQIRQTAEAFGVHRADGGALEQGAASVLGTNEIAPLTMAVAYAGIANDGVTCSAIAIDAIYDATGATVAPPVSTCSASVSESVARAMQYAMKTVMTGGTGISANPRNGIEHIGKTGTTDSAADVWTAGASSNVSLAVWVGSVTSLSPGVKANLRSIYFDGTQAAATRYAIWRNAMAAIDGKYGGDPFAAPDSSSLRGGGSSSGSRGSSTPTPSPSATQAPAPAETPAAPAAPTDPADGADTGTGGPGEGTDD